MQELYRIYVASKNFGRNLIIQGDDNYAKVLAYAEGKGLTVYEYKVVINDLDSCFASIDDISPPFMNK